KPFFFLVVETFRWNVSALVVRITKKGGIKTGLGMSSCRVIAAHPTVNGNAHSQIIHTYSL
ncbi:MAG TPA: hypothetical protein V6D48_13225, partial [Oculatellaceae cyanobacterium]